MRSRFAIRTAALLLAFAPAALAQAQPAQEQSQGQPTMGQVPVIKAETRLVLVDAIVTDKKGNYLRDLTKRISRVWEDNKEQPVKTFSV